MQPTHNRLRVLIVEDEFLIADRVAKFFARRGAEVIGFAPTARKAREILSRGAPFDVAILDVGLGDRDVFMIADLVREAGAEAVFYTATDQQKFPERFRDTTIVAKPADVHELYASTIETCTLLAKQGWRAGIAR
jgi:DNA-binding response OmpR family regulator